MPSILTDGFAGKLVCPPVWKGNGIVYQDILKTILPKINFRTFLWEGLFVYYKC